MFIGNLEYVFIIERAINTIKGDNSKCIFFFQNYAPFLTLKQKWTFYIIFVITEDMYLKHRVCVHYPKSNPYY